MRHKVNHCPTCGGEHPAGPCVPTIEPHRSTSYPGNPLATPKRLWICRAHAAFVMANSVEEARVLMNANLLADGLPTGDYKLMELNISIPFACSCWTDIKTE